MARRTVPAAHTRSKPKPRKSKTTKGRNLKVVPEEAPRVLGSTKRVPKTTTTKKQLATAQQALKAARGKRITLPEGTIEVIPSLDADWAELLLSNVHDNQRKVRSRQVSQIERSLQEGTYTWTGIPFVIDSNSELIDGQHRATAVLNTGIPITNAILVTAKAEDALKVIDTTNRPRSLGDLFTITGSKSPNNTIISAILREHGGLDKNTSRKLSKPERYDIVCNYDLLPEARELYAAAGRSVGTTSGSLAGALLCVRANHDVAMAFFTAAFSNRHYLEEVSEDEEGNEVSVRVDCPQAELLSNWFIRVRQASQRTGGKGVTSGEAFITEAASKSIGAWNAYRQNRNIKKLLSTKTIPVPRG